MTNGVAVKERHRTKGGSRRSENGDDVCLGDPKQEEDLSKADSPTANTRSHLQSNQ